MPWQQFFDGKGWENKLAGKYGVNSIPATYLLDRQGTIIGKDLRGEELEKAVVQALAVAAEFASSFSWMLPAASNGDPFLSRSLHGRVSVRPSDGIGLFPAAAAVPTVSPFT